MAVSFLSVLSPDGAVKTTRETTKQIRTRKPCREVYLGSLKLTHPIFLIESVSRLNLHLVPIHPDHSGGLAFLGKSAYGFGPVFFAQGAMVAGLVASRVLQRGSLQSLELVTYVISDT
jgi:hypothetical protein